MKILCIGRRIGFDDICAHFAGKSCQGHDFIGVTVDHVSAALRHRLHDQWFNHQWHAILIAISAHTRNILHALTEKIRLVRHHKQINDHASGIHFDSADQRFSFILQNGPHGPMTDMIIGISHINTHH
ncbi:hypothetical protein D9M72_593250 [compost metagenome]